VPRLLFVRHTAVELLDGVPPRDWPVTEEGRRAAERLAREPIWRELAHVATSPEGKAVATARPLARAAELAPRVDDDLREVARDVPVLPRGEYVDLVTRWLGGEDVPGLEPQEQAARRFAAAVDRAAAASPGPTAVVSHGLVLALHLGLTPNEWAALPLPGIVAVVDSSGPGYERAIP
jgi:2,3-bisphosphoglycerate-dependent phosphoglycerate mutase